MLNCRVKAAGVILALGGTLLAGTALGQDEKIVLRVADHIPVTHILTEPMIKFWMKEVTRETGGKVEFEYYPAEQLGKAKDMLSLALSGVADITGVVPSQISDKFSLAMVADLPGSFQTSCTGTFAFLPLIREGGIIATKEYGPLGFRPLVTIVMPPYQIFSRQKLTSVKSFEGLKIQTGTGAKEIMLRMLKAVPIRMAGPELYESLSRGTIDGGNLATGSILSYRVAGPAKFVTLGENFGSAVFFYGISEARWRKLPERIQKIMLEAGEAAQRNVCTVTDRATEVDYEKLKQQGMTAVRFPPADHQEIAALAITVRTEWADALDKRGKPGSEVLKAFTEALAVVH